MDSNICSVCHQPILPQYYFCPNCGIRIKEAPLPTTAQAQALLYVFSIVLPMIFFLFVTRWQGIKYLKSSDPQTKRIGQIALGLLIISTIVVVWLTYIWTESMIQSSINSINTDFSGL